MASNLSIVEAVSSLSKRITEEGRATRQAIRGVEHAINEQSFLIQLEGALTRRHLEAVDYRARLQLAALKKLEAALYSPSEIQAAEFRRRAERALRAGLYEDALRDFGAALERNPYDFTARFAVAAIEADHLEQPERAWASTEATLAYCTVGGMDEGGAGLISRSYYASRSLLQLGQLLEDAGELSTAVHYYSASTAESPDYPECFLSLAKAHGRLGSAEQAINALRSAVLIEPAVAVAADSDSAFSRIHEELNGLWQELTESAKRRGNVLHEAARQVTEDSSALASHASDTEYDAVSQRELLRRGGDLLARGGFLDCVAAIHTLWAVLIQSRNQLRANSEAYSQFANQLSARTRAWLSSERERAEIYLTGRQLAEKEAEIHHEATTWLSKADAVDQHLGQLTGFVKDLRQFATVLDEPQVACDVVLMRVEEPSGPVEEQRIVSYLAKLLATLNRDMPVTQVTNAIRELPAFLMTDLSVSEAEWASSIITADLGVTVGVKRRVVSQQI